MTLLLENETKPLAVWTAVTLAALLILVGFIYLYQIDEYPQYDYDEAGFLNIPYRFANFGKWDYPVHVQQAFDSQELRKYPPLGAFALRSIYHRLVGFSPLKSRVLSAFMIWSALLLAGIILPLRLGLSTRCLILLPLALGLAPPVIMAARTVRFEQEILWLGVAALLALPLVLNRWKDSALVKPVWFLCGVLSGWAGVSHPWGMVFPAVLIFSLIWQHKGWQQWDGLGFWPRAFALALGMALPAGLTLAAIIWQWHQFTGYATMMGQIYSAREIQLVQWFLERAGWLKDFLPPNWAAHVQELELSAFFAYLPYPWKRLFVWLFALETVVILVYALHSLFVHFERARVFIFTAVWLVVFLLACNFIYSPNSNYYLYLGFTVPLAFGLISLNYWCRRRQKSWETRLPAAVGMLVLAFQAALGAHFAYTQVAYINRLDQSAEWATLDTSFQAVETMYRRLSLTGTEGEVLCDFMTWAGAPRDHGSLLEKIVFALGELPRKVEGVVLETGFFGPTLYSFPSADKNNTVDRRLTRLEQLLKDTRLAGLVLQPLSNDAVFFYRRKEREEKPLLVALLLPPRGQRWERVVKLMAADPDPRPGRRCWSNLPRGGYLLLIPPSPRPESRITLFITAGGGGPTIRRELRPGVLHRLLPQPAYQWISAPGARLELVCPQKRDACSQAKLYRLEPAPKG